MHSSYIQWLLYKWHSFTIELFSFFGRFVWLLSAWLEKAAQERERERASERMKKWKRKKASEKQTETEKGQFVF